MADIDLNPQKWKHYDLCANRLDGRVSPCPECLHIEVGIDMAKRVVINKMDEVKTYSRWWDALNAVLVRINDVRERT